MIHRNIEKSLNLTCMQVYSYNAGHPCRRHKIGNEFCRDRLAPARLAVLTSIRIIRDNRRDAVCRRALACICEDQQLHKVVIDGIAG